MIRYKYEKFISPRKNKKKIINYLGSNKRVTKAYYYYDDIEFFVLNRDCN